MNLDRSKGHRGTAAFIVEKGTTGFTFGKKEHKIGIRASTAYELVFENCRIPEENLLLKDNYKPYEKESARAKLFASECAMAVTTKAVQIFGGYNYTAKQNLKPMGSGLEISVIVVYIFDRFTHGCIMYR